jgi:hypothetical protein
MNSRLKEIKRILIIPTVLSLQIGSRGFVLLDSEARGLMQFHIISRSHALLRKLPESA